MSKLIADMILIFGLFFLLLGAAKLALNTIADIQGRTEAQYYEQYHVINQ